ncbi:wd-repeat protein interacting with phosphoinosides wipi -related [Anaeramoeba flamelloides]|uniref:Wd-repeat protein interacting with phosphoinosides wipi -related n=1 Tax=Anaeramoeba flamelloides TaxID=1746091 RepID=A0AAV7YD52_9EUKA|nr:wd-repeat protein interacting with phosphoinosides wipi -related [Anaeramoeba flamelloides]
MSSTKSFKRINSLSFTPNNKYFSLSTTDGWSICSTKPFQKLLQRKIPNCSISLCSLLSGSNIVALVGSGSENEFPNSTLLLYDDSQEKTILTLKFNYAITAVKVTHFELIVCTGTALFLYSLRDLTPLGQYATYDNPNGIVDILIDPTTNSLSLLATLGVQKGELKILRLANESTKAFNFKAFTNEINCMSLSKKGEMIAVTSNLKPDIIRIFNCADRVSLIFELKKPSKIKKIVLSNLIVGTKNTKKSELSLNSQKETTKKKKSKEKQSTNSEITSISFNIDNSLLATSDSNGNIIIYSLARVLHKVDRFNHINNRSQQKNDHNTICGETGRELSFRVLLDYAEWENISIKTQSLHRSIVTFKGREKLYMITQDGLFNQIRILITTGEIILTQNIWFSGKNKKKNSLKQKFKNVKKKNIHSNIGKEFNKTKNNNEKIINKK